MRLLLLSLVGSIGWASTARACTCLDDDEPGRPKITKARDTADAVFFAKVQSVLDGPTKRARTIVTILVVLERFKGELKPVVRLPSDNDNTCDFSFEPGAEYLVYANLVDGALVTGRCHRTRKITRSDDLELRFCARVSGTWRRARWCGRR